MSVELESYDSYHRGYSSKAYNVQCNDQSLSFDVESLYRNPATIILSPLVPGDRTSSPPPVWGWGETGSVIIDLREKERDRQTNYVANQEFGRLAFVCLSFSLSRLSLSHYRSQTSTGHIDLLRIGLPGGSPQNNEHWPCQYL